jgi:hypothetical protein
MMYYVRGQVKGKGDRTQVLYATADLLKAKEYEAELKHRDDIVMTIITRRV